MNFNWFRLQSGQFVAAAILWNKKQSTVSRSIDFNDRAPDHHRPSVPDIYSPCATCEATSNCNLYLNCKRRRLGEASARHMLACSVSALAEADSICMNTELHFVHTKRILRNVGKTILTPFSNADGSRCGQIEVRANSSRIKVAAEMNCWRFRHKINFCSKWYLSGAHCKGGSSCG